jgi:hypothetical protein
MVRTHVVLALVICKVFLSRVPLIRIHTLCILLACPKLSHFHLPRTLPFDGVVCDSNRCGVIAMDRGFRLRMSHFGEGEPKNTACLTIVVQCPQFGFGGGRDDKSQNCGAYVESPVQPNGLVVFWNPTEEKWPQALLRAFASERYEASEWMIMIMSDAWKQAFTSACPTR